MSYTAETFLNKIKPMVINDMKMSGILASLTAAQAFIESNKGNSGLTVSANNLFGIKGKYNGQSVKMLTTEYYNGVAQKVYADFRKYPSWAESIADHSAMFNRLSRYANLRGLRDYKLACKYVKDDGYATSPTYTQTLIKTIETYKLYEWDGPNASATVQPVKAETKTKAPTLRIGSTGDYVTSVQTYLSLLGYSVGAIDGIYGKKTSAAVLQYQIDRKLLQDGIWGPQCWNSVG